MFSYRFFIAVVAVALLGCTSAGETETTGAAVAAAGPVSPLEGVWQVSELRITGGPNEGVIGAPEPSLYIFSGEHYSIAQVNGTGPRPLWPEGATRSDLTPELIQSTFMTYVSNSGRYELRGDTVVTRPVVALSPNFMSGGSNSYLYSREADNLVLSSLGLVAPVTDVTRVLTRVE